MSSTTCKSSENVCEKDELTSQKLNLLQCIWVVHKICFSCLCNRTHSNGRVLLSVQHGVQLSVEEGAWWKNKNKTLLPADELFSVQGEVRTMNDRNICERRSCLKNNAKSPTFKFDCGKERRPLEVQPVSGDWRLPGATHSSADLTWIRKWLEIQAPELSEFDLIWFILLEERREPYTRLGVKQCMLWLNACVCVRACVRDELPGMVGELKAKWEKLGRTIRMVWARTGVRQKVLLCSSLELGQIFYALQVFGKFIKRACSEINWRWLI